MAANKRLTNFLAKPLASGRGIRLTVTIMKKYFAYKETGKKWKGVEWDTSDGNIHTAAKRGVKVHPYSFQSLIKLWIWIDQKNKELAKTKQTHEDH